MSNKKFMLKCIIALLSCIIGLSSCGDKIPTNEIHYTTIDNSVLPIKDLFYFGEGRIVSNSYVPDKNVCILKLDKDVTKIGECAFYRYSSLTSISIPPSVTEIGRWAFSHCFSLKCISIPESVTKIGECAFFHCSSLTSISIPPSVTEIGHRAFLGCSSLTNITIPESVTEIGASAFNGCSGLTSITVSKDNKVYDSRENCNAIIHTESNTLIRGCENSTIPPSVTKIGGCTFRGCSGLTEVRIPKGCNVDEDAFKDCPNVQIIRY